MKVKITEEDFILAISFAETIISTQKEYIKELEQKVDDLQKALDVNHTIKISAPSVTNYSAIGGCCYLIQL